MKCTDKTKNCLSNSNISEADFENLAKHFETCRECQKLAESQFQSDWHDSAFQAPLKDANVSDLEYPSYDSRVDWNQVTQGAETAEATLAEEAEELLGAATHPELLGRIGRYDVEGVLGSGGTGVVFRAFDKDLHRVVAIKVLNRSLATNAAARKRFAREAQAAAAVLHPNVLPIHNVEPEADTPFLVMQYVPGQSLQARIERDGILEVEDVLRIAKQTAEALAAAHQQGLIHRDVKPANILLESEIDRAVLGDFGLARTADDASLTRTGIVAGTPHYMSPEQANGESIGPASDLFSLGGVIYAMLAGRPPFRADTAMGVLHCVCTKRHERLFQINNKVPRELSDLVCKLLAKRPQDRLGDATEVAKQLETLLARYQQGRLRLANPSRFLKPKAWQVISAAMLWVCCFGVWMNRDKIPGWLNLESDPKQLAIQNSLKQLSESNLDTWQNDQNKKGWLSKAADTENRRLVEHDDLRSVKAAVSSSGEVFSSLGFPQDLPPTGPLDALAATANNSPTNAAGTSANGLSSPTLNLLDSALPPTTATLPENAFAAPSQTTQPQAPLQASPPGPWQEWDSELSALASAISAMEQPRAYEQTLQDISHKDGSDHWMRESAELLQLLEVMETDGGLPQMFNQDIQPY